MNYANAVTENDIVVDMLTRINQFREKLPFSLLKHPQKPAYGNSYERKAL